MCFRTCRHPVMEVLLCARRLPSGSPRVPPKATPWRAHWATATFPLELLDQLAGPLWLRPVLSTSGRRRLRTIWIPPRLDEVLSLESRKRDIDARGLVVLQSHGSCDIEGVHPAFAFVTIIQQDVQDQTVLTIHDVHASVSCSREVAVRTRVAYGSPSATSARLA